MMKAKGKILLGAEILSNSNIQNEQRTIKWSS
jgi:hypothetical protein